MAAFSANVEPVSGTSISRPRDAGVTISRAGPPRSPGTRAPCHGCWWTAVIGASHDPVGFHLRQILLGVAEQVVVDLVVVSDKLGTGPLDPTWGEGEPRHHRAHLDLSVHGVLH